MSELFPTALDDASSLPNPGATDKTNSPDHAGLHSNTNGAIKAVEAKVGTGTTTPTANTILRGTGAGTTSWGPLTSAQLAAIVSDETGTGSVVFGTNPTLITPSVDTINESTSGNGVTIDGLNIKDGKLNTNNSIVASNFTPASVGTSTLAPSAVGAGNISSSAISLGCAYSTTTFTTTSAASVQVTGLTTSVTIPSNGRKIKITGWVPYTLTGGATIAILNIFDGTPVSGTVVGASRTKILDNNFWMVQTVVTPAAGAKTYSLGVLTSTGASLSLIGAATSPMYLLVEAI